MAFLADNWVEDHLQRWRTERDAKALGELLRWQRDRAFAIALRLTGHSSDAEDAVQQACIKLLSRTTGFADVNDFRITVYRAVWQCSLDLMRAERARSARLVAAARLPELTVETPPHAALEQAELAAIIERELAGCDPIDRACLVLCCQEGLPVTHAAQVLELPRETVRYRLDRALATLRGKLRKRGAVLSIAALTTVCAQQAHAVAPAAVCAGLNATLPGSACAGIACAPALTAPVLAAAVMPWAAAVAAGLVLSVGGAAWTMRSDAATPTPAVLHQTTAMVLPPSYPEGQPSLTSETVLLAANDRPASKSLHAQHVPPGLTHAPGLDRARIARGGDPVPPAAGIPAHRPDHGSATDAARER